MTIGLAYRASIIFCVEAFWPSFKAKDMAVFAYSFEGRRYDIGDKLGYIIANIEYALRNGEINSGLKKYLKEIIKEI